MEGNNYSFNRCLPGVYQIPYLNIVKHALPISTQFYIDWLINSVQTPFLYSFIGILWVYSKHLKFLRIKGNIIIRQRRTCLVQMSSDKMFFLYIARRLFSPKRREFSFFLFLQTTKWSFSTTVIKISVIDKLFSKYITSQKWSERWSKY